MPDVQVRIAVAVASNGQWNCYGLVERLNGEGKE
jgi:hypothetical protein